MHWRVLIICGGVIIGTVVVGWFFSLIMIDPFRLLAQQARAINAQSKPEEVQVRGVSEAAEIMARPWRACSPGSATNRPAPEPRWSRRATSPPSPPMNCARR